MYIYLAHIKSSNYIYFDIRPCHWHGFISTGQCQWYPEKSRWHKALFDVLLFLTLKVDMTKKPFIGICQKMEQNLSICYQTTNSIFWHVFLSRSESSRVSVDNLISSNINKIFQWHISIISTKYMRWYRFFIIISGLSNFIRR